MRIFVYEYLCSGARSDQAANTSLRAEGLAMLGSVLTDFSLCPEVQTATLLHAPLVAAPAWPANLRPHVATPATEERLFRSLTREADYTLVIAPEFDDLLGQRCRWVEEENGRLLGPSADAVRRTGDKLTLARHLRAYDVPTPPTIPVEEADCLRYPSVLKPRHGAGSQATFLLRGRADLSAALCQARAEDWHEEMILQPFVPGRSLSVAFLLGPKRRLTLPATRQHLSHEGRFHYQGGTLPVSARLERRAQRVAERAVRAIPGLHGYVGVDVILGAAEDGGADMVIEINPRLTTSYVGLRQLAQDNIMAALLAVVDGAASPTLRWRREPVKFSVAGPG